MAGAEDAPSLCAGPQEAHEEGRLALLSAELISACMSKMDMEQVRASELPLGLFPVLQGRRKSPGVGPPIIHLVTYLRAGGVHGTALQAVAHHRHG